MSPVQVPALAQAAIATTKKYSGMIVEFFQTIPESERERWRML